MFKHQTLIHLLSSHGKRHFFQFCQVENHPEGIGKHFYWLVYDCEPESFNFDGIKVNNDKSKKVHRLLSHEFCCYSRSQNGRS